MRSRNPLISLSWLLVAAMACTSGSGGTVEDAPLPSSPQTPDALEAGEEAGPAADLPDALPPVSERPWIWFHGDARPSFAGEVGSPGTLRIATIPEEREYASTVEEAGLHVHASIGGRARWSASVDHVGLSEPVLTANVGGERPTLYVAARADEQSATLVVGLDETSGESRFEVLIPDLPSVNSIEARPASKVQMALEADAVVVYLRNQRWAQIHELDVDSGVRRSAQTVPGGAWGLQVEDVDEWAEPRPSARVNVSAREGETLTIVRAFDPDEKPIGLGNKPRRERVAFLQGRAGGDAWRVRVGGTFTTDAVVLVDQSRAYTVAFCGAASGVEVGAVDLQRGELAWQASVYGIGSIGHSRYSNRVRASLRGPWLVVHGRESGGEYLAVVDRESGRLISNEIWR